VWKVLSALKEAPVIQVLSTILQVAASIYVAHIGRKMTTALAAHDKELETTKEAVRRARVLKWLKRDDPTWLDTMNETLEWQSVNEVHLTPEAYAAFTTISNWKGAEGQDLGPGGNPLFPAAQKAEKTLRDELLKFRQPRRR
jgi:hypothetical protein